MHYPQSERYTFAAKFNRVKYCDTASDPDDLQVIKQEMPQTCFSL